VKILVLGNNDIASTKCQVPGGVAMRKAKQSILSIVLPIGLALILSACQQSTTIGAQPAPLSTLPGPLENSIQADLLAAEANLRQAKEIGALPASDPAYDCIHAVNSKLGVEPAPAGAAGPASFQAQNKGLASAGSILYIQAQRLKQFAGQTRTVTASCQQLIGMIVIDGVQLSKANLGIIAPVKLP
jgi:hypothetical protein